MKFGPHPALHAAVVLLIAAAASVHAQASGDEAMRAGRDFEQRGQLSSALDSYRAAARSAHGAPEAMEAIARVQLAMGDTKASAATAEHLAATAAIPAEKAHALLLAAQASYRTFTDSTRVVSDDPKAKAPRLATEALAQAERDAAAGVAADPGNEPLRALYARILAAAKRDDEASREFTACSNTPGVSATECARAQRLAHNAASARSTPAPAFTATTLDGKPISLDSLAGKVVLIDFWATWCPVCRKDSDYVQSLLDSFPTDKFVLLEVNVEDDTSKVKNYIEENRLEGVHVQDEHKQLQTAFAVAGYPTYVILDENGTERLRAAGIEGDLRGTVKKLLAESSDQHSPKTLTGR